MAEYQYKPLRPNSNDIRLLRFPPLSPAYTLETFDLNDCPPYEALSYTWGPPYPTKFIDLDQSPFTIRENLAEFLQHMRSGVTVLDEMDFALPVPEYMWIDQICIDQSSDKEKSHQVKRMAKIYKQAQRVIVWLGREDEDSGTAMRLIADTWCFDRFFDWLSVERHKQRDYVRRLLNHRHSVETLLHRKYWNRLWIVQEFVLARDILIACGPCAITLLAIETLQHITSIRGANRDGDSDWVTITPVTALIDARTIKSVKSSSSRPLVQLMMLLSDFSMRECEDPRDKVYGLLALCSEEIEIKVDYSKSGEEIYYELFSEDSLSYIHNSGWGSYWLLPLARDMGVKAVNY